MKRDVTIRQARLTDAPELAALSTELGYPASAESIEQRLPILLASRDHLVLVAADPEDRAIAWAHAEVRHQLENDAFVQLVGLVVGAPHRSSGIGAELLAHAEEWALRAGVALIRVRSNVVRERAHTFYLRAGYTLAKTSHLFVKQLRKPLAPPGRGSGKRRAPL